MNKELRFSRKKKKREKLNKKSILSERVERAKKRKLSQYPSFVIGRTDADPGFIEAVLDAVKRFDFLDRSGLGSGQQEFLKLCKAKGFDYAIKKLYSALTTKQSENESTGIKQLSIAISGVGSRLLSMVPLEVRKKYMPYNDVSVDLKCNEIRLNFSSMDSTSGSGGTIFFSRRRPSIDFEGSSYTVGFTRHAVEQICKRYNPNYLNYRSAGDVFAFFDSCVYFESTFVYPNQPAFSLFDMCGMKGFRQYDLYAVGIFGEENINSGEGQMYYRLGYCPVAFEKGFAIAKTFILPGFRGTPEYGVALNAKIDASEKQALLNRISDDNVSEAEKIRNQDNFAAKWFHRNGIPQVFQWKRDVFIPCKP